MGKSEARHGVRRRMCEARHTSPNHTIPLARWVSGRGQHPRSLNIEEIKTRTERFTYAARLHMKASLVQFSRFLTKLSPLMLPLSSSCHCTHPFSSISLPAAIDKGNCKVQDNILPVDMMRSEVCREAGILYVFEAFSGPDSLR